jgi:hypothetical protein
MILTSNNENYVNELSKWTAHFIFCLAWFFSEMLAVPHAHQLKKYIKPQNKNFIYFQFEDINFLVLRYLFTLS